MREKQIIRTPDKNRGVSDESNQPKFDFYTYMEMIGKDLERKPTQRKKDRYKLHTPEN